MAKSEAEVKAIWEQEKSELCINIAQLEADLKRYSHTMWSIEAEQRLHQLKQRSQELKQGKLKGQTAEEAASHIDKILSLAHRCRENTGYVLIHNPFIAE